MGRPYGYLRKSSVRNLATDTSPETQERAIKSLAAQHGDAEALVLKADWDISGAGQYTRKRARYLELVAAIEDGSCNAVYSYSLSRLGRSVQELSRLFDLCQQRAVPLRLVADSLDTSTATGRMQAVILAAVAQFESEVASERQHARNTTKRLNGESLRTRRFYGDGDGEDGAAVLAAFRQRGSYSGAARLLNENGVPSRSGKPWWSSSVRVVVQRLDPSITSSGRGARTVGAFALSRLLICPTCGRFLTGSSLPGRNGRRFRRYACRYAESSPRPRVSVAESKVLPWCRRQLMDAAFPGQMRADRTAERRALQEKRSRYVELYADGVIDKVERDRYLGPITDALASLDAQDNAVSAEEIDWDGDPGKVNRQLRSLLSGVSLGADFSPQLLVLQSGLALRVDADARWLEGLPEDLGDDNLPDLSDGEQRDLDILFANAEPE